MISASKCASRSHLPGQRAAQEVHENESEGLDVVSSTLFDSQVRVDRRITCCAGQILPLCIYVHMYVCIFVYVSELFLYEHKDVCMCVCKNTVN